MNTKRSFWNFCEELAKAVGVLGIVNNAKLAHAIWNTGGTVDDAIIAINRADLAASRQSA